MTARDRHRSLTRQLVLPVVGFVLAAVLANVGFAAWLAARRSVTATRVAQARVADALSTARVAVSPGVLDALHRLTGSHFLVWDEATGHIGSTTLPAPEALHPDAVSTALRTGSGTFGGARYAVGRVRSAGVRPETVVVLAPERSVLVATLDAVWPVLAVAAATLAVLVPLGVRTTGRLAGRIGAVERHVRRIAAGEFGQTLAAAAPPDDEVSRLAAGVNHMSVELERLRGSLVAGERQRLLGQLAAGFAHELRNAITGARLAIDLHRRRCPGAAGGSNADESLAVAARQLDIVEEEVRGLLALGRGGTAEAAPLPFEVDALLAEVRDLTAPRCDHAGVAFAPVPTSGLSIVGRPDSLRAALVNLVLNGVDAAGQGGRVAVSATVRDGRVILAVEDSGAGPPESLRHSMLEPFVTGKPEGIGLGLAVARAVAEEHDGTLSWERHEGRTRFTISLPERSRG
jgi:signal transduction histidine kinase